MNRSADLGGIFIVADVVTDCLCFCTNYKDGRYRTLGDRLDIDHLSSAKYKTT